MEKVCVIGAGPAGLTAGFHLAKNSQPVVILEKDAEYVGGISRTLKYKDNYFDVGGHRFFTKSEEINVLWNELISPKELLDVRRLSRIYYNDKFYHYPLVPGQALRNLGSIKSIKIITSYAMAKLKPHRPEKNFNHWVVNRFGSELFSTFFKAYTEKVWGIPTEELSADWAAQRIQNLSLLSALMAAIKKNKPRTLIEKFLYPRLGPGQMWQSAKEKIDSLGGLVEMNRIVTRIVHDQGRIAFVEAIDNAGQTYSYEGVSYCISSMPLGELISVLSPQPNISIVQKALSLKYRDFLTVVLVIAKTEIFDDNWIYIHNPNVKVARIQNYKNWSKEMVGQSGFTVLGLEYFCNATDDLWQQSDQELISLGIGEMQQLGFIKHAQVVDGTVFRMEKAYPVYDYGYLEKVAAIRQWLCENCPRLITVGRNGMHRYNNQDHSMMTGLLAARNIIEGKKFDLWAVHNDASYDEKF